VASAILMELNIRLTVLVVETARLERRGVNDNRFMHRSLWVKVAHSSFIEGSHMTKNTTSDSSIFPFGSSI
jgi:hypothetical protein